MRTARLLVAALVGLSWIPHPAIALDQAKFDLAVGKLETLMQERGTSAAAVVRALERYAASQPDADRRELADALAVHFAESERRIAWLKSRAVTVKTVAIPADREAVSSAQESDEREVTTCEAGTHAGAGGACEPDSRACDVDGGTGQAKWNTATGEWGEWGACEVVSCDARRSPSADGRSCESERFPGCGRADRLVGGLFWAMCDSTGSHYLDYYFSAADGEAACPAGYRLPTVAEWGAAYRETLGDQLESDEHRWKYTKKLADDLRLSPRGQVFVAYGMAMLRNSFSLEKPDTYEPRYGDIPEKERADISPRPTRVYGDYRYLASDGLLSLASSYDAENPLASVHIGKYASGLSSDELARYLMPVRCVRTNE